MKGIKYEYKAVSLLKGEQCSASHSEISPEQQVPVLKIDGVYLTQSLSILEYIDETRKEGPTLLPSDPIKKAQSRAISHLIASGIQPLQNMKIINKMGDKKTEWSKQVIEDGFKALEKTLQKTSGKCCVGDEVTIADLCLVPQVYNARRFNVDMSAFPLIAKISEYLSSMPAFERAKPENQPDAVLS
eukprot:TRINITY_DN4215_c0_g1_i2.p1 TRINITY_DN4215_c0_g1~~TRINITY_DN4215_c0_g1_i2.p1  ORF type:complete len:219 (-),score=41.64 TRINITY_DN4215_c0_g1_i2:122-682(-)